MKSIIVNCQVETRTRAGLDFKRGDNTVTATDEQIAVIHSDPALTIKNVNEQLINKAAENAAEQSPSDTLDRIIALENEVARLSKENSSILSQFITLSEVDKNNSPQEVEDKAEIDPPDNSVNETKETQDEEVKSSGKRKGGNK